MTPNHVTLIAFFFSLMTAAAFAANVQIPQVFSKAIQLLEREGDGPDDMVADLRDVAVLITDARLLFDPGVWSVDLFRCWLSESPECACPPWTKPLKEWGVSPDDFPPFHWQRDQDWATGIVLQRRHLENDTDT